MIHYITVSASPSNKLQAQEFCLTHYIPSSIKVSCLESAFNKQLLLNQQINISVLRDEDNASRKKINGLSFAIYMNRTKVQKPFLFKSK